jgi:hypothetical protein
MLVSMSYLFYYPDPYHQHLFLKCHRFRALKAHVKFWIKLKLSNIVCVNVANITKISPFCHNKRGVPDLWTRIRIKPRTNPQSWVKTTKTLTSLLLLCTDMKRK